MEKEHTRDEKTRKTIRKATTFEELLDAEYGPRGKEAREDFETKTEAFCLAECLKEQRRLAGLTQEQLANKIGTKKSYISKIENGHADIQLSTLYRIFTGLGRRISLTIL
jgi:ribosome-binding protein aMBF1 (putative translation factor)